MFAPRVFTALVSLIPTVVASLLPIHSHNDYLREIPLTTALRLGVRSVEADLWLQNNELYVAHTKKEIDKSKTFASLYIDPILGIIESDTCSTPISVEYPLQLLIDFKSDGKSEYGPIHDALEPLRSKGYLTTYKDGRLIQGAVTAVGTGHIPLDKVLSASPRDLFFDAPLETIGSHPPAPGMEWGPEISPIASARFVNVNGISGTIYTKVIGGISSKSHKKFVRLIGNAHARNIKTRFWGAPNQSVVYIRLLKDSSDWLNADDLSRVKGIVADHS